MSRLPLAPNASNRNVLLRVCVPTGHFAFMCMLFSVTGRYLQLPLLHISHAPRLLRFRSIKQELTRHICNTCSYTGHYEGFCLSQWNSVDFQTALHPTGADLSRIQEFVFVVSMQVFGTVVPNYGTFHCRERILDISSEVFMKRRNKFHTK